MKHHINEPKSIQFKIPSATYAKLLQFASHIHCDSDSGRPKAASAVKQVLHTVLNLYSDDEFLEILETEGGDTLSFIQKCVKKEIRQKEIKQEDENSSRRRKL